MRLLSLHIFFFFFFNDTATTEIYTLSLHDALPISLAVFHAQRTALDLGNGVENLAAQRAGEAIADGRAAIADHADIRSEEHTSELQSQSNLVCRLLLEKKNNTAREVNSLEGKESDVL